MIRYMWSLKEGECCQITSSVRDSTVKYPHIFRVINGNEYQYWAGFGWKPWNLSQSFLSHEITICDDPTPLDPDFRIREGDENWKGHKFFVERRTPEYGWNTMSTWRSFSEAEKALLLIINPPEPKYYYLRQKGNHDSL
jgi:hypothetical protein